MTSTKSYFQLSVEKILSEPVGRFDIAARLAKIQAATIQECAEIGFEQASMTGVARRAGVSTATLYKHFRTKTELFSYGVLGVIPMVGDSLSKVDDNADPIQRVENMLRAHATAFGDPYMAWLYRLHVSLDSTLGSGLLVLARGSRSMTEQHWSQQLARLETEGFLVASDHVKTTNLILGPIERRTVLARLLFGEDDVHEPNVEDVVRESARVLFAVFGTQK